LNSKPSRPRKWARILQHLADGHALTRFDAEQFGDHALNSTISVLSKKGIVISRTPITLEGRYGVIHCNLYALDPDQQQRAREILARCG
jgi:hypothetical protein